MLLAGTEYNWCAQPRVPTSGRFAMCLDWATVFSLCFAEQMEYVGSSADLVHGGPLQEHPLYF